MVALVMNLQLHGAGIATVAWYVIVGSVTAGIATVAWYVIVGSVTAKDASDLSIF